MRTKLGIRIVSLLAAILGLFVITTLILHFSKIRQTSIATNPAPTAVSPQTSTSSAAWTRAVRASALTFQANEGQSDAQVRYLSQGDGYELFLTGQEAVIALREKSPQTYRAARIPGRLEPLHSAKTSTIRLQLDGANKNSEVSGVNLLQNRANYFIGNDPKNWVRDVPSYSKVKYTGVYPGIDLVFYGDQRRLEYDLIVAPGADPGKIAFDVAGAKTLHLNSKGNLVMGLDKGEVELQRPAIYQESGGQRNEIAGNYAISGNHRVTIAISKYDPAQPLVIDPVLDYSTFLGGSQDDTANGIAVDAAGDAYVAGSTMSLDFPTSAGAFQGPPPLSVPAVFVTELNPTGTAILNSTYLSGTGGEQANGIAVDPTGNIYVVGQTFSSDYPTTSANALIASPHPNANGTAFITVLKGNTLVYSSYLGGTAGDSAFAVAADANGQAYITGAAFPSSFVIPGTANTFSSTITNVNGGAFLARIDTTKIQNASLAYYTFLSGSGVGPVGGGAPADAGLGVAVDTSSNAYITGYSTSSDFPTTANGFVQMPFTGAANGVLIVARIDTTMTGTPSLVYSGYVAGPTASQNLGDFGEAIALGPSNVAYVTGTTASTDFPTTTGAFKTTLPAPPNAAAFVTLVDTSATGTASLKYSTYFGGSGGETGTGIAVDSSGIAYVSGNSGSTNLPVTPGAFQTTRLNNNGVGFVLKLNPLGTGPADELYATYLGGTGDGTNGDFTTGIGIDSHLNAYVTGQTVSSNFPVTAGVVQHALAGPSDAFVTELGLVATLSISPNPLAFGTQLLNTPTLPMTVTLTNNSSGTLAIPFTVLGLNAPDFVAVPGATGGCGGTLAAGLSCTIDVVFTPTLVPVGAESATLSIANSATPAQPFTVALTGTGSSTGDFNLTAPATANLMSGVSTPITVTVNGLQGFTGMVNLTCAGSANVTSCTMMPTSVNVTTGIPSPTSTATVVATASFLVQPDAIKTPPSASIRQVVFLLLGIAMLFMIPMTKRSRARFGLAAATLVFVIVAGCGGGGNPPPSTGSITITGTAPGTPAIPARTVTVNLTISK